MVHFLWLSIKQICLTEYVYYRQYVLSIAAIAKEIKDRYLANGTKPKSYTIVASGTSKSGDMKWEYVEFTYKKNGHTKSAK